MTQDDVADAFDFLIEEIENAIENLNQARAQSLKKRDHDGARDLAAKDEQMTTFHEQITDLREKWIQSFGLPTRDETQVGRVSETGPGKRSPKTILKVTFPDGRVICDPNAAQTFTQTLVEFGLDRVKALGQIVSYHPLLSHEKIDGLDQHEAGGYYITTLSNTVRKKKLLEEIARMLKVKVKVERIKPH